MNGLGARPVVVTPIYEDVVSSRRLFRDLAASLGDQVRVVAVDDGSVRDVIDVAIIEEAGLSGVVLRLRHNVGHQRAIAVGLCYVAEHMRDATSVVVMDSDGEDPPDAIPRMLELLAHGEMDVVVAERKRRQNSAQFRACYWLYKRMFAVLVGRRIAFGNFIALKPSALRRIVSMSELWIHLPGCVIASKLRIVPCAIDRHSRYDGSSKMNFVSLVLHGFRAVMVFSEAVLVRMGIACMAVAGFAVIGGILAVGMKLTHHTTPGWSTIVLGVLLLVFMQMGALTLMMLMLAGLMRASSVTPVPYGALVAARNIANSGSREREAFVLSRPQALG